jgi:hypothetical protein
VQQANDFFWADMASQGIAECDLKLAAILLGDVGMVDEAQYGDEPGFDPDALARYARDPRDLQHFTVLSVWLTDDKPDFVRTVDAVEAVDWQHAELLARKHRQSGEFLIAGVTELWVNTLKVDPDEIYATRTGEPLAAPVPPEQPKGHHGWRLFGH